MTTIVRNELVDGVGPWHWHEHDAGAWDGPKKDWETDHKRYIQQFCRQFRTAVQLGGNQGMYPRLLSPMFKTVFTFEADPANFGNLLLNTAMCENVRAYNVAVGNEHRMVGFATPTYLNTGMHHVDDKSAVKVPMIRLDSFPIDQCDLLMLDVEGFELEVVKGALNIVKRDHPVIFIERGNGFVDQYLSQFGYNRVAHSAMDMVYA